MYILFEHYKNIDNYFKQRMMLLGGKGDWVHCELVFDEVSNVRASSWGNMGMDFEAWENIKKPQYFELYPLPSQNWKQVYDFMYSYRGSPYDKIGVLSMVYGLAFQYKEGKFCSEICYEALQLSNTLQLPIVRPSSVSPMMLRRYIINAGLKPVSSTVLNK